MAPLLTDRIVHLHTVALMRSHGPMHSAADIEAYRLEHLAFCVGYRRVETLLCWEAGVFADIVYAARSAGVALDTPMLARTS